jgi:hypothetical protein
VQTGPTVEEPVKGPLETGAEPPAVTPATPKSSLWNDRFNVAGPVAAGLATVTKIPGLGDPMAAITLARKNAELKSERLIEAMLKSTQGSVREQERLAKVYDIRPSAFTDPDVYGTRLISLGRTLQEGIEQLDLESRSDGTQGTEKLSAKQRTEARQRAMLYRKVYDELDLPMTVNTQAEVDRLASGTEFLWKGTTPLKKD